MTWLTSPPWFDVSSASSRPEIVALFVAMEAYSRSQDSLIVNPTHDSRTVRAAMLVMITEFAEGRKITLN